jgi:ABC-type multidrug transport system ATPase subunit
MKPSAAIILRNITKHYKSGVRALNDISLEIPQGTLYGLIGPDGAGKTSLIRILATLLLPDQGEAYLNGLHVKNSFREIRRQIGYMPGKFSLYQDLSVEENLNFFATIFNTTIRENYHLVKDIYVQLEPFKNRRAGNLSGGMKQKLALCCALIHKPTVLLLDEPTTGVDPVSRKEFWEMLSRLKERGITILVSTPYMDEASLCGHIALIQKGEILKVGQPEEITRQYQHPLLAVKSDDIYRLLTDLRTFENTHTAFPFGEHVHLSLRTPLWPEIIESFLVSKEHTNVQVQPIPATIEDAFMDLMR